MNVLDKYALPSPSPFYRRILLNIWKSVVLRSVEAAHLILVHRVCVYFYIVLRTACCFVRYI